MNKQQLIIAITNKLNGCERKRFSNGYILFVLNNVIMLSIEFFLDDVPLEEVEDGILQDVYECLN